MRLSGASLLQSLSNNDFRTVASDAQHGFVESRNNSSWQRPAKVAKIVRRRRDRCAFLRKAELSAYAWLVLEAASVGGLFHFRIEQRMSLLGLRGRLLARRRPDTALVTPITVPMTPVMYPSDHDQEGTVPP
jgi:hypothetical protein